MTLDEIASLAAPTTEAAELQAIRRRLHRYPELRFAETATSAYLAELILPLADEVITGFAGTGLLAKIDSGVPGPTVLLRADMDAYPVTERNVSEFSSTNPGVSHACGHDAHMTVMVGVLRRLAERGPARGAVHVLFQPAEEIPFGQASGARTVLESGVLDDSYAAVLGLHCWPQLEAGSIGVDRRISMAAKDAFRIVAIGVGAHAATPELGRDALLAIADLVTGMHAVIARRRNAHDMVALNVGTIEGGVSQSVVPQSVSVTGTLRTHDEAVRARCKQTIEQLCAGYGIAHDLQIEIEWADEMPALLNDPDLVTLAHEVGGEVATVVDLARPPLTSDDFALLAERWPGLYVKLGVASPGQGAAASLHSPLFDIDESCLRVGVSTIERLTRAVLSEDERTGDERE